MKSNELIPYTVGPWEAKGGGYRGWNFSGGYLGVIVGGDGSSVYAGPASFHSLRGETIAICDANAKLMAASPEMYEAIGDFLSVNERNGYEFDSNEPEVFSALKKAYEKASFKREGEL